MRVPWWAIPGVAAIVLTLASVSAAEASLNSARVTLPREVQLSTGGTAALPAPTTHAVAPPGSPPATEQPDRVVAPSRPVITQTGTSPSGPQAAAPAPSNPSVTGGSPGSGIEDSGGGSAPVTGDTAPSPPAPSPTGGSPSSAPTGTQPAPPSTTTTTTTRPWRGDE